MTQDLNKGIINISYNHLNLPTQVTFAEDKYITYFYDATGVKLQKVVTDTGNSTKTNYAGNYIYEEAAGTEELKFFNQPEGYVEPEDPTDYSLGFNYIYQYKDHLGNIRLSYADADGDGKIDIELADEDGDGLVQENEIVEENNYYPFGLEHKGYNSNVISEHNYENFQGQELTEDLGLNVLEFKYRMHDPAIGRFISIDPLAEQYNYQSPYNFAENRVIDGFELEGLEWVDTDNGWEYQGYDYGPSPVPQNAIGVAPEGSRPVASWVSNAPIPQTGQVLNVGGPDGTIEQFPANENGMVELPHSGTEQTGAGTSGTYDIDGHTVYGYYNRNDVAGAVEDQWGTVENVSNMINAITEFDTSSLLANPLQIGDMRSPTNGKTNISASSTHHGNNGSFDIRLLGTNGGLPGGTTINNNNFSTQNTQSFINALGNNGFSRFLIGPNAVPNLNNSGTINVRNGGNVHNNHYHIDVD
jgi:RHS repeat-associated protein